MSDSKRETFGFAAAFMAWIIGSGFATGQEILQFFSSFGIKSYFAILINLIGYLIIGRIIVLVGYKYGGDPAFNHFKYFCGDRLGKIYTVLMPVLMFPPLAVILSASGTALQEYFGVRRHLGSFIMAMAIYLVYLGGFTGLLKTVSKISPAVIVFTFLIGEITILRDGSRFSMIPEFTPMLSGSRTASFAAVSGILYLSESFITGSSYYINLGGTARDKKTVSSGAVLGSVTIIFAIAVMNTAILLHGNKAGTMEIPSLYLANRIHPFFAGVFSVILTLGLFSSCSATLWTICNRIYVREPKKNKIAAGIIVAAGYGLSLFPFSSLVGFIFPLLGYFGLIFNFFVLKKGWPLLRDKDLSDSTTDRPK